MAPNHQDEKDCFSMIALGPVHAFPLREEHCWGRGEGRVFPLLQDIVDVAERQSLSSPEGAECQIL